MTRPFTDEELGLNMAQHGEPCVVCRKQSDASRIAWGQWLCGTHFDDWVRAKTTDPKLVIGTWILTMRENFAACWEASLDEETA
jgi:hypothetical protein